jgi:hypothetical protein
MAAIKFDISMYIFVTVQKNKKQTKKTQDFKKYIKRQQDNKQDSIDDIRNISFLNRRQKIFLEVVN